MAFSFFEEASDELMSWLSEKGTTQQYEAGSILIKEGVISEHVFILINGEILVKTTNQNGIQQRLAVLNSGAIVGDMSWLEQRPAVADIVTNAKSKVLHLDSILLDNLSNLKPILAAEWQRLIAKKLAAQIENQNAWIHRYEGLSAEVEPLRKVLILFSELNDLDINTLAKIGRLRRVAPSGILIKQGQDVPSIFLILAGEADILVDINGVQKKVGSSRRGELLGELTLVNSTTQGATATVRGSEGMELLEINKIELLQVLNKEPALADRFFRSLSLMMSQRSRDQLLARQLAARSQGAEHNDDGDELDLTQLGEINRAGQRFSSLCQKFQSGGRNQE